MAVIESHKDAALLAAQKVESTLADAASRGSSVLLLCSGGSWLSILPERLPQSILPESLTLSVIDERLCTENESNFHSFSETALYRHATDRGAHIIDPRLSDGETFEDCACRFETAIKKWQSQSMRREVIALMGLGSDGHTMGIFPDANVAQFNERFASPNWAIAYDAGENTPACRNRLTLTGTFMKGMASIAIMYASGESKRDAILRVLKEEGEVSQTPGRILNFAQQPFLYTDITL